MQLINNLSQGLEILNPFLKEYGFELDKYDFDKSVNKHFTLASYKNEDKKFIISNHFSIGQVLYQYENSIVSHPFYLDHLGYAHKKKHHNFQSENKLEEFNHILNDFKYLTDDFFKGKCHKLQEISNLQENIITEIDRKIRIENNIRLDTIRIEKARSEFKNKEYIVCLDIYKFVDNKFLLIELDYKIIEYCSRHL